MASGLGLVKSKIPQPPVCHCDTKRRRSHSSVMPLRCGEVQYVLCAPYMLPSTQYQPMSICTHGCVTPSWAKILEIRSWLTHLTARGAANERQGGGCRCCGGGRCEPEAFPRRCWSVCACLSTRYLNPRAHTAMELPSWRHRWDSRMAPSSDRTLCCQHSARWQMPVL